MDSGPFRELGLRKVSIKYSRDRGSTAPGHQTDSATTLISADQFYKHFWRGTVPLCFHYPAANHIIKDG